MKAQEGFMYELAGKRVVALSTGERITVADLSAEFPQGGQRWVIDAVELTPTGMRITDAHRVAW